MKYGVLYQKDSGFHYIHEHEYDTTVNMKDDKTNVQHAGNVYIMPNFDVNIDSYTIISHIIE